MHIPSIFRPALLAAALLTASAAAATASPLASAVLPVAQETAVQTVGYYRDQRDVYRPHDRRHHSEYSGGYYRPYRYFSLDHHGFRPHYFSYSYRPRYYDRDDRYGHREYRYGY